jgi:hypothetical protein
MDIRVFGVAGAVQQTGGANMNRKIETALSLAVLSVATALTTAAGADEIKMSSAEPTMDMMQNPGCGVKLKTKAEKIARNQHLAEYYFQGWSPTVMSKYGHQFRFNDYDCFTADTTYRMGFGLKPEPPEYIKLPLPPHTGPFTPKHPPTPFSAVLPDWGTIPGTLRVYAGENSTYFIMRFGGTTPKGEHIEFWEVDFFLTNDDGHITHWEGYNDVMGVDQLFHLMYGKGVKDVGSLSGMMPKPWETK